MCNGPLLITCKTYIPKPLWFTINVSFLIIVWGLPTRGNCLGLWVGLSSALCLSHAGKERCMATNPETQAKLCSTSKRSSFCSHCIYLSFILYAQYSWDTESGVTSAKWGRQSEDEEYLHLGQTEPNDFPAGPLTLSFRFPVSLNFCLTGAYISVQNFKWVQHTTLFSHNTI